MMFLSQAHLANKKVLVRLDLNIPLYQEDILKDVRLNAIKPTINYLRGNKIMLLTHLEKRASTSLLQPMLEELLNERICFIPHFKIFDAFNHYNIILLENIRFFKEEVDNNISLAKKFAMNADVFVNEAFSASHRQHASIMQLPHVLPSLIGLNFEKELTISIKQPSMLILGGNKTSSKFQFIEPLSKKFNYVFVGGVLGNTILKARGKKIGHSFYQELMLDECKHLNNDNIILPEDAVCGSGTYDIDALPDGEFIRDIGPKTIQKIENMVRDVDQVIWNGPLGCIESQKFREGSLKILESISRKDAIIGGGDTLLLVKGKHGIRTSTGGGALLYYLSYGTLPGLEAVKNVGTFEI